MTAIASAQRVAWWKDPETTLLVLAAARRFDRPFTFAELSHQVGTHQRVKKSKADAACGAARKIRAIVRDGEKRDGEHLFRLSIIGRRMLVAQAIEEDRLDREWEWT